MNDRAEHSPAMPGISWWIWATLINLALVLVLYWLQGHVGFAADTVAQDFSLVRENNIAVWWAGFCLMVAGLLFWQAGSIENTGLMDRSMWLALAGVVLALSLDETGSLHERVSLAGGWWALLPFGIVGSAIFLFAITRCLISARTRATAMLVLASLSIFFGVVAMEHLGNTGRLPTGLVTDYSLVIEEGMELLASMILLLAGVLALASRQRRLFRQVSIVVDPSSLWAVRELLYASLFLHLSIAVLLMPWLWDPGRGNPVYWLPMLGFTLLSFHCAHRFASTRTVAWFAGIPLFLLLSAGQMHHLGELAARIPGLSASIPGTSGFHAEVAWTALPALVFIALHSPLRATLKLAALTLGLWVLLRNGGGHLETYYLFSGVFALLCFRYLVQLPTDKWRE